jgi:hypothetical protein
MYWVRVGGESIKNEENDARVQPRDHNVGEPVLGGGRQRIFRHVISAHADELLMRAEREDPDDGFLSLHSL